MTKTYAKRDSATAVLRKLGVAAKDYDLFIKKIEPSVENPDAPPVFEVNLEAAQTYAGAHADQARKVKGEAAKEAFIKASIAEKSPVISAAVAALVNANELVNHAKSEVKAAQKTKRLVGALIKKVQAKPTPKNPVGRPGTCSAVARQLILDGKTNQEVWDAISVQFNLSDKKRLYPAWYRRELKLHGFLKG